MKRLVMAAAAAAVILLFFGVVPARADDASGPDRITLVTRPWGSLYYHPDVGERYQIEQDMFGAWSFVRRGIVAIKVSPDGDGWYVTYPGGKSLAIQPEGDTLRIVFQGKESSVVRHSDGFVVTIPGDVITCRKRGREVTIRGKAGSVRDTESGDGFVITSPAGTTRYLRAADGVFHFSGVPLNQHPYVRRGVYFEADGVGAFVAFPLPELGRAFSILDWEPEMAVP